jgi:hypothetical protein
MLHKVQLQSGPFDGRLALVCGLKPEIHFRLSDPDGTQRDVSYRQLPEAATR